MGEKSQSWMLGKQPNVVLFTSAYSILTDLFKQNHRSAEVGRNLCRCIQSNPLLKAGPTRRSCLGHRPVRFFHHRQQQFATHLSWTRVLQSFKKLFKSKFCNFISTNAKKTFDNFVTSFPASRIGNKKKLFPTMTVFLILFDFSISFSN